MQLSRIGLIFPVMTDPQRVQQLAALVRTMADEWEAEGYQATADKTRQLLEAILAEPQRTELWERAAKEPG